MFCLRDSFFISFIGWIGDGLSRNSLQHWTDSRVVSRLLLDREIQGPISWSVKIRAGLAMA